MILARSFAKPWIGFAGGRAASESSLPAHYRRGFTLVDAITLRVSVILELSPELDAVQNRAEHTHRKPIHELELRRRHASIGFPNPQNEHEILRGSRNRESVDSGGQWRSIEHNDVKSLSKLGSEGRQLSGRQK